MNSDGISKINLLRSLYQARDTSSSSEVVRELQEIKNEIKIANDEKIREEIPITNATKSPYLPDQIFYKKDVVFNSPEETSWRNIPTSDEVQKNIEEKFSESNKKKLNII